MSKRILRVVQVGTYYMVHAAHIAKSIRSMPEEFELLGIIEEDAGSKARALRDPTYDGLPFLSWEEAIEKKPDAFIIETEEHEIVPNAIKALKLGFPVHIDKPGGENHEEFSEMCRLAEEKGLVLSVGYMYRCNPAVLYALDLMKKGALGEITSVEANMSCLGDDAYRRSILRYAGGMMFYLGCHMVDLVVHFQGFPEEVAPFHGKTGLHGIDCADNAFCVFRYPKGASFVKVNCTEYNGRERRQVVITGTGGTVEIRPIESPDGKGNDTVYAKVTQSEDKETFDKSTPVVFEKHKRYDNLLKTFAACLRGEMQNPYTPQYEEKLHALIMQSCEMK